MTQEAKPIMARRDGNVSILKPWVTALTIQAQGALLSSIRGPDGAHKNDPAKAIVRAFRATVVNNAKNPGPGDVFMGDGTGVCSKEEVDLFFHSIDQQPHHWYLHFIHVAEIVGYTHPNDEIRQFWNGFYRRAVEGLHLSPEHRDVMLERLRKDGTIVDAGELGPCKVCGDSKLVYVLFTESLRVKLVHCGQEHDRAGLCSNCLTPRTARSV
jgi:hypothetical protein